MHSETVFPKHLFILILAILVLATNAAADTATITGGTPLTVNASAPRLPAPTLDPSVILKQLDAVKADNQRLRSELRDLSKVLLEMDNNTPSCLDRTTSTTKGGIQTDCWPRTCDGETGLCLAKPVTSDDCAGGFSLFGDRCATNYMPQGCPGGYRMETLDSGYHMSTCVPNAPLDCGPNHVWSGAQEGCVPREGG